MSVSTITPARADHFKTAVSVGFILGAAVVRVFIIRAIVQTVLARKAAAQAAA
jgi:hypothetical protein